MPVARFFEKFEDYGDVGFAIILLTADDIGRAKTDTDADMRQRARQNVIMELGYIMAKLGRGQVCALLQDGVEIPSDISGIVIIHFASGEKWQNELTRELEYAGLNKSHFGTQAANLPSLGHADVARIVQHQHL